MANPDKEVPDKPAVEVLSPNAQISPGESDPLIGAVLDDKYTLVEFIGSGGWSNVYRGEHCALGISVAVKIIHQHLTRDQAGLKRLQHEAISMSRLESPFIVRIMDHGLSPFPYIVMEYFDGVPLEVWLRDNGCLKSGLAIELFKQICQGLSDAHKHGIIHRDLKPSNIMLKIEGGRLKSKILDFGIAKMIDETERLTSTGEILGSPPYMSPEQFRGQTDHRSDIYSLGCLMYETLSGKPAFSAKSSIDYVNLHLGSIPSKLQITEEEGEFPEALEDLIHKCLEKSPDHRYQSAEDVLSELERVGTGRKLQIRISRELRTRQMKMIIAGTLAFAGLAALLCWQRESVLDPWCNYFNTVADREKGHFAYDEAIANYHRSLLVANLMPVQHKRSLHAMRMLSFCLRQKKQFKEAAELQRQVDLAIGAGPWPEFSNVLRRLHYSLCAKVSKENTRKLENEALSMAAALAGKNSLAYSQALDAIASIMRAEGSYKEALQAGQESLRIAEALVEADSIALAERLNHLSETLKVRGESEQAERAFLRALQICSQNLAAPDYPADGSSLLVPPLVLADFDSAARATNRGGVVGTWEKDVTDKLQGVKLSSAAGDARGLPSGRCLQLTYDVDSPSEAYNGIYMKLENANFSSFDTFNIYAKGDASVGYDRRLSIELKDFSGKHTSNYFIHGISNSWQKFSIPFDRFTMVSDWSHMNEFAVVFSDIVARRKTGQVYLDDLFLSCENQAAGKVGALTQMVGAYNGLASIRMQMQEMQDALNYFEKAYQLCRSHREIDSMPVLVNMVSLYKEDKDRQKNLEYWRRALNSRLEESCSKCPENEVVLSELADICCQLENYKQAEVYYEAGFMARVQDWYEDRLLIPILKKWIEAAKLAGDSGKVAVLERSLRLRTQAEADK